MRARNLQVLTNEIRARHPGVVVYGIGDDDHKTRASDHNEDDTAGSRPAQSDPDSTPEHRAIDVMLGPAFTRSHAETLVRELLAHERLRSRLYYIIFYRRIWSRSTGWAERAKTDDPHTDHVHISGWAADDGNTAGWLTSTGGGSIMFSQQEGTGDAHPWKGAHVALMQKLVNAAGASPKVAEDGEHGPKTSTGLAQVIGGNGTVYGPDQYILLNRKVFGGARGPAGLDGKDGRTPTKVTLSQEAVVTEWE